MPMNEERGISERKMAKRETMNEHWLLLDGLNCAACVLKVEKALKRELNVQTVQVNLVENTALVQGDVEPEVLIEAVKKAGYSALIMIDEKTRREKQKIKSALMIKQRRWQTLVALIVGISLMSWGLLGGSMIVNKQNQPYWFAVGMISAVVIYLTGKHFYRQAWKSLKHKTATMDTLVALGTGVAWLFSMLIVVKPDLFPQNARHLYFESSVMVIAFINLGKLLEMRGKQRSSTALERLLDLTPKTARVVKPNGEIDVLLEQVQQGDILRLVIGDSVPVDGSLKQGTLWIDESMLTGEPLPVKKETGDRVRAGTLVTDGSALLIAEQIGRNTTLANIIKLVRNAQSSKPKLGQLADKIAAVFVPVVIGIALLSAILWYFYDANYAFVVLTAVLIIACPCALGLATPMSIIAGVGRAAEIGVLVRNADALQKASGVDTIVFDKTGTLTQGSPKVTALYSFNGYDEKEVLALSASIEQNSRHPLAKAILNLADEHQIVLSQVNDVVNFKGLGITGFIAKKEILLGNEVFLKQNNVDTQAASLVVESETEQGASVVFLAVDKQLIGLIAIRDSLRENCRSAVQRLSHQGYQLIMLTGDQMKTAQVIAQEVGIEHIIAGVLPEEKIQEIKKLQSKGHKVMMAGDGINDAPALAQANVSIAMGEGSDVAIEIAELTLMRANIDLVADILHLSKQTLKNIKENLFFAFLYNGLAVPIAAGALYPFYGILLNPMVAGSAMALSSITVAVNANRLLYFKSKN